MGARGEFIEIAVHLLGAYLIIFILVPFLSAVFIYQGFQRFKFQEINLGRCVQACFFAAAANIVCLFALRFVRLRGPDNQEVVWVMALVYLGIQLLLVPLLMRKWSWRALLIEFGGLALGNLCGYGIISFLLSGQAQA